MIVLGIESSCDETAMAILEDGVVRSSVVASQIKTHREFGGVVPEIASREHITALVPVLDETLKLARINAREIDAIGVTAGPGLIGSLLVGVSAAKALAHALDKPLYAVHHIVAHIMANRLAFDTFEPPFVALVISGGHTHLYDVDEHWTVKTLARTRDDAAGESFDKVARAMGLPYPGGPEIDRLAKEGDSHAFTFPTIQLSDGSLDFSFSGLKTAALNFINQQEQKHGKESFDLKLKQDFAASFQEAVVDQLVNRSRLILQDHPGQRFAIAGGVAANSRVRAKLGQLAEELGKTFYVPPLKYCGDNAAMVASLTEILHLQAQKPASLSLNPTASWDAELYQQNPHTHTRS